MPANWGDKGSKSPVSKLTEEEVVAIKRKLAAGVSQAEIARQFGISKSTVSGINTGRIWSHIRARGEKDDDATEYRK